MKRHSIRKFLMAMLAISTLVMYSACSGNTKKSAEATDEPAVTELKAEAAGPLAKSKSENGLPTVIDFYATWCGPCMQFRPVFHKAEEKYKGKVDFKVVDVDEEHQLAEDCNVEAIPTVIFLDADGKEVKRYQGMMNSVEFEAAIDSLLSQSAK